MKSKTRSDRPHIIRRKNIPSFHIMCHKQRPTMFAFRSLHIRKLIGYTTQKGFTLVPLAMYINEKGLAKLELGVARGKKNYDKRDSMIEKAQKRAIDRAMKEHNRY